MPTPIPTPTPTWWLTTLTAHGPVCKAPDAEHWTWDDQESGVRIDKLTHVWQTVAWTPHRSVTLRTLTKPGNPDMHALINLAGLTDLITNRRHA